jgi:enoyl-CoA hydratase
LENLILITEDKGIVILTINRPKALNAINRQVMEELNAFFSEGYKSHSKLIGIIITGAGSKAFVAGADIKEFGDLDEKAGADLSKYGHDTYFLIENFHVPVIAAVNGFALGGGCELAMACHMRIASENARFGQPEVNLGLIPGYGGTQRLIQLIGKGKAIELLLTADMIPAEEARQLGLANHVVPSGTEVEMAEKIIRKIGTKGPEAVNRTIALVSAHFSGQKEAFDMEYQEFGKAMASDEAKEGASAFLEKRRANFQRKL